MREGKIAVLVGFGVMLWWAVGFAWEVPDTGQTKCYDEEGAEIVCPPPGDSMAQDGSYVHRRAYTKLGYGGVELPDDAEEWLMVRDGVTGLVWEVKQNKGDAKGYANPNDAYNTYTWYDSNSETNGGDPGTEGDGVSTFDTEQFIQALNDQNFGGFSDWRLPSIKELDSIVDLGSYDPAIETGFFPNTQSSPFWSATPSAYDTTGAWFMYFEDGHVHNLSKSLGYLARAVRSGKRKSATAAFIDNGDGTVTDIFTGLMWQQTTAPGRMTWAEALSYCEKLNLSGIEDWRLPDRKELRSIVDYNRYVPAIDTTYFPDTQSAHYWSSTNYIFQTGDAWIIDFSYSLDPYGRKSYPRYTRAVRSGQNRLPGHLIFSSPHQASGWSIGSRMPITWNPQEIQGGVKLSISRMGGRAGTFEVIGDNTPNDGEFDWTVTGPTSVNCALKIEPISDPSKGNVQSLFRIGDILVDPAGLTVQEPDDFGAFKIRLGKEPTAEVTVELTATNPGECNVSPESVTLTSDNWNTGATATVTAEPDGIVDGDQITSILTGLSSSADPYYDGLNVANVAVTVQNIDAGLAIDSVYPTYGELGSDLDVKITGVNFDGNTALYMYPDGGAPAAAIDTVLDSPTQLSATLTTPTIAGSYTLEVSNGTESAIMPGAISFAEPDTIQAQTRKKAIIVAGGGPFLDNDLWLATESLTQAAYIALTTQGYTSDTIQYLSLGNTLDITGDGENDVDGPAAATDLESAVTTWAADNTDELILYLTGPGRNGAFQFGSDNDPEFLTPETLDAWLDDLQTTMTGRVIVVIDSPQSGSFLAPLADQNRIVITGASATERAWFLDDGEISFSWPFWDAVYNDGELFAAFDRADDVIGQVQTPAIDADGDGRPDPRNRRSPDDPITLGRGRDVETDPPAIGKICPDATLDTGTAYELWAEEVTADNGLSQIWARIFPPVESFQPGNQPVLVLPTLRLQDLDGDDRYAETYEDFTQNGGYKVLIHAVDKHDFQSIPKAVRVTQTAGLAFEIGDLNVNGEIDLMDPITALKAAAGLSIHNAVHLEPTGDERIGVPDALYLLQQIGGLGTD